MDTQLAPARVLSAVKFLIPLLLCLPVFFQLSSGLFRDPSTQFDTQRTLADVPLPVSLVACYAGLFLFPAWRRVRSVVMVAVGTSVITLGVTLLPALSGDPVERAKLLLAVQFILPVPALLVGAAYASREARSVPIERIFLYVTACLVPLQLVSSWVQGSFRLRSYVYLFTIHQHEQYVATIVASMYVLSLFSRFRNMFERKLLVALAPMLGIYATASGSTAAILFSVGGAALFVVNAGSRCRKKTATLVVLLVVAGIAGSVLLGPRGTGRKLFSQLDFVAAGALRKRPPLPPNLATRQRHWTYYVGGIMARPETLLYGHEKPPQRPSAHNYYLDYVYNFGVLATAPLVVFLVYTIQLILRNWRRILSSPDLSATALVVLFLLLVDNSLKVGLRQPYPGVLSFFLWGLLTARLEAQEVKHRALSG